MRSCILACTLLLGLAGCGFPPQPQPSPHPTPTFPTMRVTADQVARSLQQDEFFATYGRSSLLVQGTVVSIDRRGTDLVVVLDSTVPTKVACDVGAGSSAAQVGDTITIRSADPGRDALRDAGSLLLRNCQIPADG